MAQSWPWGTQIAIKKDHKNLYLLTNNSNNKEEQIMYAELTLAIYCTYIF